MKIIAALKIVNVSCRVRQLTFFAGPKTQLFFKFHSIIIHARETISIRNKEIGSKNRRQICFKIHKISGFSHD